ncbi:hypothetical protein TTHERM_00343840 (macronuclear) [Tetrahymena thermophila SB210]|uniref:Kinase domain protein n=1 Tax=Tetrahymena thermophila (strain SB210) TaxID=312017 RepID=I7M1Z6_TETTS|nr:hypothetical protein TTHERM_00343840 [Tetrahymena thermophila SB210]EAR98184.1 hypothetical protein TTHERM_00343840 [Tetrahymena thermophila SB210]|eukprot:XP_001018429.1 hypothetical protein TTHERM_00343840 [Tetrahymena thermophila SB210]
MSNQLALRESKNAQSNGEVNLNLQDKQIDSSRLKLLLSKALTNNFIQSLGLQLNGNIIGDKGLQELVSYLNTLQKLEKLSLFLSGNKFSIEGVQKLLNFKLNSNLKNLTLQLSNNMLGQEAIRVLGLFISKLSSLKQLNLILDNCDLGNCGAIYLCQQIKGLKKLNELYLNLNDNSITDNGVISSVNEICQIKSLASLGLDICSHKIDSQNCKQYQYQLYYNVISNDCVKYIIKTIGSQLTGLKVLNLDILYYTNQSCQLYKKQGYEGLEKDLIFSKSEISNLLENTFSQIQTKQIKI